MTVNRKPTGTASSIPVGLASGAAVSMGLTVLGALATAKLIDGELLAWDKCGYAVLMILMLSAWAGATVTAKKIKRHYLPMCLAAGGVYFAVLLISTALFFGGQYSGVGETALLIFCGSMLAVLMGVQGKTGRNRRKIKI